MKTPPSGKMSEKTFRPMLTYSDESHRSIYHKYRAIFEYFDAMLVGLTATPKDDIDINTYSIFGQEIGVPTYAYDYQRAVQDHYLVSYHSLEYKTKIMEDGIHYDELSDSEKKYFEEEFSNEPLTLKNGVDSSAINKWLFKEKTIDTVLINLMEKGIKVDAGDKLGKTIIFAVSQKHAQAIEDRFNALYPQYGGKFARTITFNTNYVQDIIDEFSKTESMPQIAISVDMLDTGIDVPDVVNLVFFKKVRSKAKFWQMMGRGTRLRPNLFGQGEDKEEFLVFDYCHNMEFFRAGNSISESSSIVSLSERIYRLRTDIVYELIQQTATPEMRDFVQQQIQEKNAYVKALDERAFNVRMKIQYVHKYKKIEEWETLTSVGRTEIKENIAPLVLIPDKDIKAKYFDRTMYMIELAYLTNKSASQQISDVMHAAEQLYNKQTIPEIVDKLDSIKLAKDKHYWDSVNMLGLEKTRKDLRDLMKYLVRETRIIHYTKFDDDIIFADENKAFYDSVITESYKEKLEFYLKAHEEDEAIKKLKTNIKLTDEDVVHLEKIFWSDLGTREDYRVYFGETPLTKLIRKTIGLDRDAANEAFSEFLTDQNLSAKQIHFVELIIDYIVKNGFIEDKRVLREDSFRTVGSITELFGNNMNVARKIIGVVDSIYANQWHDLKIMPFFFADHYR